MRKLAAAVFAVLACLTLSGCATFTIFDAKNLMAPPKVNEDQQAIYQLLQGDRQEVTYVFPKSGEYRSAVITRDITGDGQDDAIGFLSLEDSGGTEVRFLTKADGEWTLLASFRNQALQVDRVCFGHLSSQTREDVLIGWGSASGATGRTASAAAYLVDGAFGVRESVMGVYGEMALTDLDGDGLQEVFTVDKYVAAEAEGEEPTPATARLFAWDGTAMREAASAPADNNITSYSQALAGLLNATTPGVALDGARADGSLTTQVFTLQEGRLVNYPEGVNTEEYATPFYRPSAAAFLSRDINGDGFLEIPMVSPLPLAPEEPDSTSYLADWAAISQTGESRLVARTLVNSGENYWIRVPYRVKDRITAVNDPESRTVTYSEVLWDEETGEPLLGAPLFSIRAFPRSAWEERGAAGKSFLFLASQGDVFYGLRVRTEKPEFLSFCDDLPDNFHFLSE